MVAPSPQSKVPAVTLSTPLGPEPDDFPHHPLGNWFGHLKVSQKIILGYGLVLATVILGTTIGFITANHYQQKAIQEEEDAIEELYQVYRLKSAVSRVRSEQHKLIIYIEQPDLWQESYPQLLDYVFDVEQEWAEFQVIFRNPSRRLKDTPQEKEAYDRLMLTKNDFDDYLNRSEVLFAESNPTKLSPETINAKQHELLAFMHDVQVFSLDKFLDDITHLVDVTALEYEDAKADLRGVEQIRLRTITASLILSTAIAALLAIYMNRAISGPIQAVTHVAQQVTEEANFDLQAPVTTQDEIGILAASLNRLIQEVQQLLETQRQTNEQLEVYSEVLERKVRERTHELKEKNQSLQKALDALRYTQAQLGGTEDIQDPDDIAQATDPA